MMMETVVYSREYLFVKEMHEKGELGRIQFLRGSHQQDMDGWPDYWPGLPPMWYATHCVSPCLAILSEPGKPALADAVVCLGSGRIREELVSKYGSPYAVETATVHRAGLGCLRRGHPQPLRRRPAVSRVVRRLRLEEKLRVAAGREAKSRSSTRSRSEQHFIAEADIPQRVPVPDYAHLLPKGIQSFTQPAAIQDAEHLSFVQGGGHGGSHPHLVHAFLSAVRGEKPAFPDAETSANWTMVGLCAHESAQKSGDKVVIPRF